MAYTRINRLKRINDIQKITRSYLDQGVSLRFIYNNYIYPAYRISLATFYNYLSTPAARELKKIDKAEGLQFSFK